MLGTAAILAVTGLAGLFSSFAYDLMLGLAALFGASAVLSMIATTSSRARWVVVGSVIVVAAIATDAYIVSRAGGPPGSKPTLTPWWPIAMALLATTGAGLLVQRATRDLTVGVSAGLLVMAVILALLAQIATVAYVPAALLLVMAFVGFGIAGLDRARGSRSQDT
jgi:hypothetical protein